LSVFPKTSISTAPHLQNYATKHKWLLTWTLWIQMPFSAQ
jgi:hypothetical protein